MAKNYETVIPSLTLNTPLIRNKASKVAYILRHAMNNPGWTSSQIEGELVSMRRSDSEGGSRPTDVATSIQADLQHVLRYHYDDLECEVKTTFVDGATYKFTIKVTESGGVNVITAEAVKTEDGEFILTETELNKGVNNVRI